MAAATGVAAMTEPRPRRSRARNALSVYATTAALFVTVGGFLGLRMAQGQDPALGPQTAQISAASGSQSGRAVSSSSKPLQTRTSGAAQQPNSQSNSPGASKHSPGATKKKLQTRTSGHGGHRHDGSESHDA